MSETAVTEAAMKIQQIPGFRPVRIGFISGSGFEKCHLHYEEIDGEVRHRRGRRSSIKGKQNKTKDWNLMFPHPE
jgi:hypothetical protein